MAVVYGAPYEIIELGLPRIGALYMSYLSQRFSAGVVDHNRARIAQAFATTCYAVHTQMLEDAQRQLREQPEVQP